MPERKKKRSEAGIKRSKRKKEDEECTNQLARSSSSAASNFQVLSGVLTFIEAKRQKSEKEKEKEKNGKRTTILRPSVRTSHLELRSMTPRGTVSCVFYKETE